MTSYYNDILDLLQGETPRQKYEYLNQLIFDLKDKNNLIDMLLTELERDKKIIVLRKALSAKDREIIESYLIKKYNCGNDWENI